MYVEVCGFVCGTNLNTIKFFIFQQTPGCAVQSVWCLCSRSGGETVRGTSEHAQNFLPDLVEEAFGLLAFMSGSFGCISVPKDDNCTGSM